MRRLTAESSDSNVSVLIPARVAAPISVLNRAIVAKSALHSEQNFSSRPGRSNKSVTRPHSPHCFATLRPTYMSFNIAASFLALPAAAQERASNVRIGCFDRTTTWS